jgi:hypothetical protein
MSRYSTPSPESVGVIGRSSIMRMSAQRFATSAAVMPGGGAGDPLDGATTGRAFGLVAASGAVMPAWLTTFTRNTVQPCCTSRFATGPIEALRRLSGLISTIATQRESSASWIPFTANSASSSRRASSSRVACSPGSG